MSQPEAINISRLSFSYGAAPVLKDINVSIAAGEFFGLIGPNAAGKSTLIKLLMGLMQPDAGEVKVLGKPPAQSREKIGYVPQHASFPRNFPITVAEVVMLGRLAGAGAWGGFGRTDREAAQAALEAVAIGGLASRAIASLSGGQLQRMLLARALVCQPEVLLLDEPTANIDVRAEENIFALLKRFNDTMTIIVVSHDVAFISGYVHRVGCLNQTLVCHETESISGKTIEELYGASVRMIDHAHAMPVAWQQKVEKTL